MVQIVDQTREERTKMYLKLSKKELVEMLINSNEVLKQVLPISVTHPTPFCQHDMMWVQDYTSTAGGYFQCKTCGYSSQLNSLTFTN